MRKLTFAVLTILGAVLGTASLVTPADAHAVYLSQPCDCKG